MLFEKPKPQASMRKSLISFPSVTAAAMSPLYVKKVFSPLQPARKVQVRGDNEPPTSSKAKTEGNENHSIMKYLSSKSKPRVSIRGQENKRTINLHIKEIISKASGNSSSANSPAKTPTDLIRIVKRMQPAEQSDQLPHLSQQQESNDRINENKNKGISTKSLSPESISPEILSIVKVKPHTKTPDKNSSKPFASHGNWRHVFPSHYPSKFFAVGHNPPTT